MKEGRYVWQTDLTRLQATQRPGQATALIPVGKAVSPLRRSLQVWAEALADHPDPLFASYIIEGIREGLWVGCSSQAGLRSVSRKLLSTEEHKEVVEQYIEKEVSLGRIVGPITGRPLEEVHISPFGVIPKKTVGKWRLITDLSSPQNGSVNETISEEVASLHYVSVDSIARQGVHG